ncbi:hypothetical protein ACPOL_0199 [Acidisarcina polymorpha]|uniref:Uncharacterized protein n=1 Tax=Acidisarcina polymorpha TaxID=2211140 RepID=A0A2Z5FSY9_9BACT|nr:hypothetical protein ACPOL_0199 [Acidisarcina polymorpha]
MEETVVNDIAFAVFPFNDPLAFLHMAKTGISGDGAGLLALFCVYEKWSAGTKCTHEENASAGKIRLVQ